MREETPFEASFEVVLRELGLLAVWLSINGQPSFASRAIEIRKQVLVLKQEWRRDEGANLHR